MQIMFVSIAVHIWRIPTTYIVNVWNVVTTHIQECGLTGKQIPQKKLQFHFTTLKT